MPGANLILPIALDRRSATPLSRQLQTGLRDLIARGGLPAGALLPPSRRLAPELGVSRNVVLDAYAQLRHEGLLTARRGEGTRVSAKSRRRSPAKQQARWRLDLHPDITDLSAFPRAAWGRAVAGALHDLPDRALGYRSARGIHELRVELAAYLARTRGVVAEPESIVVCEGLMSAVGLIREALELKRIAVPRVAYPSLASALRRSGPPTTWLDVDGDGAVFTKLPRGPGCAALVEPAHHYPLGMPITPERVEILLAWASERRGLILESDANADLHHSGPGPRALQGRLPDSCLLIGSVSRVLAPGLRLGWIVAPPALATTLARHKAGTEPASPVIDQMAFARFLADGELDRHLRRLRSGYRRRAKAFSAALEAELPQCSVTAPASGFHVIIELPDAVQEQAVVGAAAQSRVRLSGLGEHVLHGPPLPPGLLAGYGALPEPSARRAASAIRRAISAGS
jgi:GntR family transcriptional regulator/MocR family aminotransferase